MTMSPTAPFLAAGPLRQQVPDPLKIGFGDGYAVDFRFQQFDNHGVKVSLQNHIVDQPNLALEGGDQCDDIRACRIGNRNEGVCIRYRDVIDPELRLFEDGFGFGKRRSGFDPEILGRGIAGHGRWLVR